MKKSIAPKTSQNKYANQGKAPPWLMQMAQTGAAGKGAHKLNGYQRKLLEQLIAERQELLKKARK
jgi:hypothetical protein